MTNHWVLHLILTPSLCIWLGPSPPGPGNGLDLITSTTDTNLSPNNNIAKQIDLTPAPNLTIDQLIQQIIEAKYDTYTFRASGQGCRFWFTAIVKILFEKGCIIEEEEVKGAKEAFGVVWIAGRHPALAEQQSGIVRGTF